MVSSRSPHGERGLKYHRHRHCRTGRGSLSSWRAWIEITSDQRTFERFESLSSWRAWIEIKMPRHRKTACRSLSSWRAWIEIPASPARSSHCTSRSPHGERGLKSEETVTVRPPTMSLSSWRAWIEIIGLSAGGKSLVVALLMESVD